MTVNRYADDLAYVHHTGFADLARGASKHLVALLGKQPSSSSSSSQGGAVVDLGCGSGIVLRALTDAGYSDVVGVDLSASMLAIAARTAPAATLVRGSLYDVALPRSCRAVFAVGEPLSYGDEPLTPFLKRVAAALVDGGLFVFDVIVDRPGPALTRRMWQSGADWLCAVDSVENKARTRLTRAITTFRRRGGAKSSSWTRDDAVHDVRVLKVASVTRLLRHAGFDVRVTTSYGDHPLAIRRRAFVCTRRAR